MRRSLKKKRVSKRAPSKKRGSGRMKSRKRRSLKKSFGKITDKITDKISTSASTVKKRASNLFDMAADYVSRKYKFPPLLLKYKNKIADKFLDITVQSVKPPEDKLTIKKRLIKWFLNTSLGRWIVRRKLDEYMANSNKLASLIINKPYEMLSLKMKIAYEFVNSKVGKWFLFDILKKKLKDEPEFLGDIAVTAVN